MLDTLTLLAAVLATPRDDAARIEETWSSIGLRATRAVVFAERGKPRRVRVEPSEDPCTTVTVIGPRHAVFALHSMVAGEVVQSETATAGIATVSACGEARETLALLHVDAKPQRVALEVVVAHGKKPAPDPFSILPHRAAPAPRELRDPGRAPSPPLADRVAHERAALKTWGATDTSSTTLSTQGDGAGSARLELPAGCHRLAMLAHDGRAPLDLDAELTVVPSGELLARDASEAEDAHVAFCVGESTRIQVTWRGAPRGRAVEVVAGRRALSTVPPASWGPKGVARASEVLLARTLPPAKPPFVEAEGTDGAALVPIELDAGTCFLVLGAHVGGTAAALSAELVVDGVVHRDDGGVRRSGFAITACPAKGGRHVVRVEGRGAGLTWGLSVHPLGKP